MRIVLVSDGNETDGDLKEAARTAAANGIPIDVLPLEYRYDSEVLFKRLVAPPRARSGQTIPLRFVLQQHRRAARGLMLTLNGQPVDLDPDAPEGAVPVELEAGDERQDGLASRGHARHARVRRRSSCRTTRSRTGSRRTTAPARMTFVAGPGHVLVVDARRDSAGADAG